MAYQNYTGTWDFTIPVRVDPSREQTVAVNDKNADGNCGGYGNIP